MSLISPSQQELSRSNRSEEHGGEHHTDGEATWPLTEDDLNSIEPTQAFSPLYLEPSCENALSLDFSKLQVDLITSKNPTARILLYPRIAGLEVSPYGGVGHYDNWVEVKKEYCAEGSESVKILVVNPSTEQLGCIITHGDDVRFRLYFDPAQDRIILRNDCSHSILVTRLDAEDSRLVQPRQVVPFCMGCWAFGIANRTIVEFQLLSPSFSVIPARLAYKRRAPASSLQAPKRLKVEESTYRTTDPSWSLKSVSAGNMLVKLDRGETIRIGANGNEYHLTRLNTIADQPNSSVWQAKHSNIPGRVVVVKVIKAASTDERDTVRAAESWIRESTIHSSLESHSAIVHMLGSDARFQSIYIEHVDAKSLLQIRQRASDNFAGNVSDARRVLSDMASALDFVHKRKIVHNDVKLANILYSSSRGAVLIDFGLSFVDGCASPTGGSPWYLPPEFMRDWRSRGPLCDVWALGVVTLWLLNKISLPEKSLNWLIADIHPSSPGTPSHVKATATMSQWLKKVEDARSTLDEQNSLLSSIVKDMLAPELEERIPAAKLNQTVTDISSEIRPPGRRIRKQLPEDA